MVISMKNPMRNLAGAHVLLALSCCLALSLFPGPAAPFAPLPAYGATAQELSLAERIYREGILPSGEHLQVAVKGDAAVPGLTFSCASCHLRSGIGAYDEGINTPAISGGILFRALPMRYKGYLLSADSSRPTLRPAYTEETLIEVLRTGRDPKGRVLNNQMPRYHLSDRDAGLLVAYLRTLSSEFSPGFGAGEIRFATVISEDLPAVKRDAMLSSLDSYFKMKNNQLLSFSNPLSGTRARRMAESMQLSRDAVSKSISLAHWTLKGAPDTWRAQLEEYNRREPVFALLGGMVTGSWQPIHQFCEENRIPALFPETDLPVISDTDWYTLYASKGYFQEGEGAARFLNDREVLSKGGKIVQVVRSSAQAAALAAGFQQAWRELGGQAPVTLPLARGKLLDRAFLQKVLAREKPAILLVWDDASALPGLESLARGKGRPTMVLLSARYLGEQSWRLPEQIRDFSYLTYPFVFSTKVVPVGMSKLVIKEDTQQTLKKTALPGIGEPWETVVRTYTVTQLLSSLLMDLNGNYYRDNLLDVSGMMSDQLDQLYGRLSFATDQRYASRGCYIVQLSHGATPELVKKSDWIGH
jgi:hypothetical protein